MFGLLNTITRLSFKQAHVNKAHVNKALVNKAHVICVYFRAQSHWT